MRPPTGRTGCRFPKTGRYKKDEATHLGQDLSESHRQTGRGHHADHMGIAEILEDVLAEIRQRDIHYAVGGGEAANEVVRLAPVPEGPLGVERLRLVDRGLDDAQQLVRVVREEGDARAGAESRAD